LLPQGRLREDFKSLERAQAVALTKINWADPERVAQLKKRIPEHVEIYEVEFHQFPQKPIAPDEPVLAVSGIANPEVFEKNLKAQKITVPEHLAFPDHHQYTFQNVQTILETFHNFGCRQVITTEKDFVKLSVFPDLAEIINPIKVQADFTKEPQGLYAFLDRSHRL
jgi:tetraacyldisaccharide 4'-kinase